MTLNWTGLYSERWDKLITPESTGHPAKMSRGLVFKIYEYALGMNYIKLGDTVLDPFGGIGGTALPALTHGINWVGNELEPFFVDCARGCDCTGISKEDYRRFYGRWRRVAYKDERHWCPQCIVQAERSVLSTVLPLSNASKKGRARIAELEASLKERGKPRQATLVNRIPFPELFQHIPQQFDMFGVYVLEASYSRNSHKIPYTEPHHYSGNLENWRKYAKGGAVAVCYQGDSRFLSSILGQVEAVVSSPPFADSYAYGSGEKGHPSLGSVNQDNWGSEGTNIAGRRGKDGKYGNSDSQLANLPDTGYDMAISSPPFADSNVNNVAVGDTASNRQQIQNTHRRDSYGPSDSQLGSMKDDGFDMVVSSSPFANSLGSDNPDKRGGLFRDDKRRNDANLTGAYGDDEANLGTMVEGEYDAIITSPPFLDPNAGKRNNYKEVELGKIPNIGLKNANDYGNSDGQLGSLPDKDYDLVISSPSWAGNSGGQGDASRNAIDPGLFDRHQGGMKRGTGDGEAGNIDHMSEGDYSAVIGSPPFENVGNHTTDNPTIDQTAKFIASRKNAGAIQKTYGNSDNQLGNQSGPTFWAASKDILLETNKVLRKGGYTFWVCKAYIKSGRVIDFPDMWKRLCEVCGFEHVETIHAWQTEDKGTNFDFEGEAKKKVISRKSFFRQIYEKKYPENAIDFETVLVLRKL